MTASELFRTFLQNGDAEKQAASHISVSKLSYSSVYARKMTFIQGYCLG
jgi:hypothetical protein